MDGGHQLVAACGDDCNTVKRRRPFLPQTLKARENERFMGFQAEIVAGFGFCIDFFPLIKPVGRHKAAPFPERRSEARFFVDAFRPCIEHVIADFLVLGPGGHEALFHCPKNPEIVFNDDDRMGL